MKNPIQTFGPNLKGRDFVIGDLHGAYACYENLCKNIQFDEENDRMFSVSDLIDRGPDSLKCLQLIKKDNFHSTLANHDHMMLEAFRGGPYGQYWMMNGGGWGLNALKDWRAIQRGEFIGDVPEESQEVFDLVDMIDELPFLITINHKNGKKFHLLHAELPPKESGEITDEDLANPELVRSLAMIQSGDGDAFLWARYLWWAFNRVNIDHDKAVMYTVDRDLAKLMNDNRSHVISGHTILRKPLTILNHTNIDTCAYGACETYPPDDCALTCIELDTWTFYQATPTKFRIVEPITVTKEDLPTPEPAVEKPRIVEVDNPDDTYF